MFHRLFIYTLCCLLFSCQGTKITNSGGSPPSPIGTEKDKATTLKGVFRSSKGVKDPLSCYCFDGGYLTTTTGESFAVCFDNLRTSPDCESVELSGSFLIKSNDPEPGSVCAKGEMKIFKVTTFQCR